MQAYVAKWELMSTQFSSMVIPIDGLFVKMLVESFDYRTKSRFGLANAAMLTKNEVT